MANVIDERVRKVEKVLRSILSVEKVRIQTQDGEQEVDTR
jgi:hypothetical protein